MGRMWNAPKLAEPILGRSDMIEQVRKLLIPFVLALTRQWSHDPSTLITMRDVRADALRPSLDLNLNGMEEFDLGNLKMILAGCFWRTCAID